MPLTKVQTFKPNPIPPRAPNWIPGTGQPVTIINTPGSPLKGTTAGGSFVGRLLNAFKRY